MTQLTPQQIVAELDRYIIGQHDAKRAVAIALRNRWRRQQLPEALRDEVMPKNILMIGPTGVGKTEIARRLAKLSEAPFIKVEATKFTEVGYVGRDVDSIIRDLLSQAIHMMRDIAKRDVLDEAARRAQQRVLVALVGDNASDATRDSFRQKLERGELHDKQIDIAVQDNSSSDFPSFDFPGGQMSMLNIGDMISKATGGARTKTKTMTVRDALEVVQAEEADELIDDEKLIALARDAVEQRGIVFIDEIDKIAARAEKRGGGDISREGVQRDLLPLIEGTTVSTKHGFIKTDHILFITSGAFHVAKPSDLLPELQGRLPIRVELKPLTAADFKRILLEPEASLIKQYEALLQTENVTLVFDDAAIDALAQLAFELNVSVENIGARRLHTVLEKLLEDISYDAPSRAGERVVIDAELVKTRIAGLASNVDLSKFIL